MFMPIWQNGYAIMADGRGFINVCKFGMPLWQAGGFFDSTLVNFELCISANLYTSMFFYS